MNVGVPPPPPPHPPVIMKHWSQHFSQLNWHYEVRAETVQLGDPLSMYYASCDEVVEIAKAKVLTHKLDG